MLQPSSNEITLLKNLYSAFNQRNIDDALAMMSQDVEWPKAFKGGFVQGHKGVRDYWSEQWSEINPHVKPISFKLDIDNRVLVTVHLVVKSLAEEVLTDTSVGHLYVLKEGLIQRMDICEVPNTAG